jgi:GNAT superfamily N-acetyltransferase
MAEWLRGHLTRRIASGDLCVVALSGQALAGFNLVALAEEHMPLIHKRKILRRGQAWSSHIAVAKEFRRHGVASALRQRVFRELRNRGIHRLYGATLSDNVAALQLARSAGFRFFVDIHYARLLWWRWWRYRRVRG